MCFSNGLLDWVLVSVESYKHSDADHCENSLYGAAWNSHLLSTTANQSVLTDINTISQDGDVFKRLSIVARCPEDVICAIEYVPLNLINHNLTVDWSKQKCYLASITYSV